MEHMSNYQRKKCLEVIDSLMAMKIAKLFSRPVHPERDGCPNYFDVIDTPMDLRTVREKIISNKYKDIYSLKADVDIIWENCYKFNGKISIISSIARQLQQEFESATSFLTGDDLMDWVNEGEWLKTKIGIKSIGKNLVRAMENMDPIEISEEQARKPDGRKFYQSDRIKLANHIRKITNIEDQIRIVKFIEEKEPEKVKGNEVDLEIDELKENTLIELRKYISWFKKFRA